MLRLATFTAVFVTVVVLTGSSALATSDGIDNMFPTANYHPSCSDGNLGDTFCQTDNSALSYFEQSSLSSANQAPIDQAIFGEYDPTHLNVSYTSTPSYSGSSETDIIYQFGTVPSGLNGITWCDDAVSSVRCDQHYIRFNFVNYGLACHETGHAVGLTHGDNASPVLGSQDSRLGCMVRSVGSTTKLGAHNIAIINETY